MDSNEDLQLTKKFLKPANWKLHGDISDEQWKCLPEIAFMLDLSEINFLSAVGLKKIAAMEINFLNISNLKLEGDLRILPQGLKKLYLRNTNIKIQNLQYLPKSLEEIDISNTLTNTEDLEELLKRGVEIEGDPSLLYDVAYLFYDGRGVKKDIDKSIAYLKKASVKGSDLAHNFLGVIYELGVTDEKYILIPLDTLAAKYHYEEAVKFGSVIAIKNLARVKENIEEMLRIFNMENPLEQEKHI